VVGLLASVVVSTWPPTPCDEPLAGGSLVGLLSGGISLGFFELTRTVGTYMLGFNSQGLMNSTEGVMKAKTVGKKTGHVASAIEISINFSSPQAVCPYGSIDSRRSRVLLQCHKCP
jgi:hypothetical protein